MKVSRKGQSFTGAREGGSSGWLVGWVSWETLEKRWLFKDNWSNGCCFREKAFPDVGDDDDGGGREQTAELRMGEKLWGSRVTRLGKVVPRLEVRGRQKNAMGQGSGAVLLVDKPKTNSVRWFKEGEWRSE